MELNRVERRALFLASALAVIGAAVRVGVGPTETTFAWRSHADSSPSLDSTRSRVAREIARAERIATPLAPGELIDPNIAPSDELQRLPGIGPRKAAAIVAARDDGPLLTRDDLLRVVGIGPATVDRLRPHLQLTQPVTPSAAAARPEQAPGDRRLDLNSATVAELVRLPGLGPKRAAAIADYRARYGPFRSVDEVTDVAGIGPTLLQRLRPRLFVR